MRPGALVGAAWAALVFASAACGPAPVVPTQDRGQRSVAGRIEGTLFVQGPARGNAVVFLFSADRPPPPSGTGRPVSFTVVPGARLFGDALGAAGNGPFSAPFTFSLVPPGEYLLKGFLDTDGCLTSPSASCRPADFLPWFGVTAETNAGDVGGGAVDPATSAFRRITVSQDAEGEVRPATGVAVSFAPSATLPTDRPVFRVTGEPTFDPLAGNKFLELSPVALDAGPVHQSQPAFFVRYADDNGDGTPDDSDANGVLDVYPKVYVRKLADGPPWLLDESDRDKDGIVDPTGPDYEPVAGAADGLPDAVALAAGLDVTELFPLLTTPGGAPRMDAVPVTKLRLVIRPVALDVSRPEAPVRLKSVPKGRYAITVVQFTGQSWRVPNELQRELAPAFGLPAFETQEFMLVVP